MTWLLFAFLTVFSWGIYGVMLHAGQVAIGDPGLGRYKAFLWVGLAYFVTAVLAPLIVIVANGGDIKFWGYGAKGIGWSFFAGVAGAIGAFGVLLAFGAAGSPSYVPVIMSIIFCGAPIVNSIVALSMHPPKGGLAGIPWPFYLGIVLAAVGGFLVVKFKPGPGGGGKAGGGSAVGEVRE